MAEYIEREAAEDAAGEAYLKGLNPEWAVRDVPTADVVPVVHGRWIEKPEETYCPVQYGEDAEPILHRYTRYICNLCGRSSAIPEPYCHCGAKMDGGAVDG